MNTANLSSIQIVKIKKMLAFSLRHKPFFYKIKLDKDGYANLDYIVKTIKTILKIENVTIEDVITISKQFSGGIFEINSENNKIRARSGHTVIYNLLPPAGFIEIKEVPSNLHCHMLIADFVYDNDKLVLSNKQYILSKTSLPKSKKNISVTINSKKMSSKDCKFFYNESTDEYFTPFVIRDCLTLNV